MVRTGFLSFSFYLSHTLLFSHSLTLPQTVWRWLGLAYSGALLTRGHGLPRRGYCSSIDAALTYCSTQCPVCTHDSIALGKRKLFRHVATCLAIFYGLYMTIDKLKKKKPIPTFYFLYYHAFVDSNYFFFIFLFYFILFYLYLFY